ncbi:MAG TPA: class I SAM-dependent methyltransferase [Solirubrobacterales bacterium]|jgi:SAM-dependent methyltransferase
MPSPDLIALAAAVLEVPRAPERALEIECGGGDGALFLAREYPAARVRGVDASEDSVQRAAARVGLDPEGRVAFKRGRPGSLPYPNDHFDLVAQLRGRIRPGEAARVLRAGGHLVLAGPVGRLVARNLRRHGIEQVASGGVDGSDFFVGRLGASL